MKPREQSKAQCVYESHNPFTRGIMIPVWLQAGLWGLFSGGALLIGAAIGYRVELSNRRIAGIMAFGAGVLISALCFELMEEAFKEGGLRATVIGFAAGAVVYSAANWGLSFYGAKHRKRRYPNGSAGTWSASRGRSAPCCISCCASSRPICARAAALARRTASGR
jgi:hypothetical protein